MKAKVSTLHTRTSRPALSIRSPLIIQAPMAGGITTPKLVASVSNHGGLGSFATGYLSLSQIKAGIREIKKLTSQNFSVNIFINSKPKLDQKHFRAFNEKLEKYRDELKLDPIDLESIQQSIANEPNVDEIIDVLCEEKVKAMSFTFGLLLPEQMERLKKQKITVMGTATTLKEALILQNVGCDMVIAQSHEAGGHRGNFSSPSSQAQIGMISLLQQLQGKLIIPYIAAGGIASGRGILAAMTLGAQGVQMGTAFLGVTESGINPVALAELEKSKDALEDPTSVTDVYTGKFARGLVTRYMEEMRNVNVPDYPVAHLLTAPIRKKSMLENNPHYMSFWAGQSVMKSSNKSVEELLNQLYSEFEEACCEVSQFARMPVGGPKL